MTDLMQITLVISAFFLGPALMEFGFDMWDRLGRRRRIRRAHEAFDKLGISR